MVAPEAAETEAASVLEEIAACEALAESSGPAVAALIELPTLARIVESLASLVAGRKVVSALRGPKLLVVPADVAIPPDVGGAGPGL